MTAKMAGTSMDADASWQLAQKVELDVSLKKPSLHCFESKDCTSLSCFSFFPFAFINQSGTFEAFAMIAPNPILKLISISIGGL